MQDWRMGGNMCCGACRRPADGMCWAVEVGADLRRWYRDHSEQHPVWSSVFGVEAEAAGIIISDPLENPVCKLSFDFHLLFKHTG